MSKLLPFDSPSGPAQGDPVQPIPLDKLLLDTENPRLKLPPRASQDRVMLQLYEEHRLEELMQSFIANGYFDEEPLVAVPHSSRSGYYIVIEGNRRLAALKILTDPKLAAQLRVRNVPDATDAQIDRLKSVPVKLYRQREDVLPYLGFRHITGIKEWDAESKARYVYQLKEQTKLELSDISDMIGDTYKMTERLYLGMSLLRQAEAEMGVSEDDFVKFPFSYMYDAVRMPQIKTFLGLGENQFKVPRNKKSELGELLNWLFGSRSQRINPVVDRKDQLKQLGYVVSEKKGTTALRQGLTLEEAYQQTVGEREQLTNWLVHASRELDRAKGILHRHRTDQEVRDLVGQCSETISLMMKELGS